MPPVSSGPRTTGAAFFDPDALFATWAKEPTPPQNDDLRSSIITTFNLPSNDSYVYHAIASVTLSQVQEAVNHGSGVGLHAWYRDHEGKEVRMTMIFPLSLLPPTPHSTLSKPPLAISEQTASPN